MARPKPKGFEEARKAVIDFLDEVRMKKNIKYEDFETFSIYRLSKIFKKYSINTLDVLFRLVSEIGLKFKVKKKRDRCIVVIEW